MNQQPESDQKFVKKKVIVGEIDADIANSCILIPCEVEANVVGGDGKLLHVEKKVVVKKFAKNALQHETQ